MTPADLAAFVLGCALACFLPWIHEWPSTIIYRLVNLPAWIQTIFVLGEVARKLALAITPVIVSRRIRYGGLPRPSEWLAIFAAGSLIPELIQWHDRLFHFGRWCFVDLRNHLGIPVPLRVAHGGDLSYQNVLYTNYQGFPSDYTPYDEYRIWGALMLILLVGSLITVGLRRGKLPHSVTIVLMAITGFASVGGIGPWRIRPRSIDFDEGIAWLEPWVPSSAIVTMIGAFPVELLLGVAAVATFMAIRHGHTQRWVWTDWVAVIVAAVCFLQYELPEAYVSVVVPPRGFGLEFSAINLGPLIQIAHLTAVGVTARLIVMKFGPAWNHLITR